MSCFVYILFNFLFYHVNQYVFPEDFYFVMIYAVMGRNFFSIWWTLYPFIAQVFKTMYAQIFSYGGHCILLLPKCPRLCIHQHTAIMISSVILTSFLCRNMEIFSEVLRFGKLNLNITCLF